MMDDKASSSSSSSSDDDAAIWHNLKHWVHHHGGHVHPALHLQTNDASADDNNRGVIATQHIAQGELLIRLPIDCALSGRTILTGQHPNENNPKFEAVLKNKSSWMQCVAAYYHALLQDDDEHKKKWKPYLDSLPKRYETLFQWSDEEIKTYLRGTTLGAMILTDRIDGSMKRRYQTAVRPVLKELALLEEEEGRINTNNNKEEDDEMKTFLNACMCISTRAFHHHHHSRDSSLLENKEEQKEQEEKSSYQGPFLLPIIDLLNHNPSKSCTSLQYYDSSKGSCFCMVAERPIVQGEEIFHTYGDSMTSAQLLQTYGFVMVPPPSPSSANDSAETTTTTTSTTKVRRCLTPASLSKSKHLIPACQEIKKSGIPKRLQSKLLALKKADAPGGQVVVVGETTEEEEEEESWEVSNLPIRDEDGILSEDVLIDCNNNDQGDDDDDNNHHHHKEGLTDDLITWMCLQFLPTEAYDEMCDDCDDGQKKVSALLDATILQDLYLGILVCRSLLLAMNKKLDDYEQPPAAVSSTSKLSASATTTTTCLCETTNGVIDRLEALLGQSAPSSSSTTSSGHHHHRAPYGWTIRKEELSNLKVCVIQVSSIMKCLYDELLLLKEEGDEASIEIAEEPKAKRKKVEAE